MAILALIRERAGDYDCPVCKRSLTGCSLSMLREEDPLYTVQVSCARCKVTFVVVLQVREQGSAATAAPSSSSGRPLRRRSRARRRPELPPIVADELLDLHQLLRDHRGSLTDLLRPAGGQAPRR